MKLLVTAAAMLAFAAASTPVADAAQTHREPPVKLMATFPDLGGRVFEPGEEVAVAWKLQGSALKFYETNPWGECELLLTVDDGATWSRITPQLSVTRRDFRWVVPDLPTASARIALQVGIEGDGDFHHFASESFAIAATGSAPAVLLTALPTREVAAGSTIELAWTSTVADIVRFEVLISSDRGAHFFRAGETQENRFAYRIPGDYEGSLTVQIVAHRQDSAPVRSTLDAGSTLRVQGPSGVTR